MLIRPTPFAGHTAHPDRQRGVVLLVALIVLVAMTLAGIALVRSVDTGNMIAGNLTFKQAATGASDVGVETAINWLETNNTGTTLLNHNYGQGYSATFQNPAANQTWENYWTTVLDAGGRVRPLGADGNGNSIAYAIDRLCPTAATTANCAYPPASAGSEGSSKGSGVVALLYSGQIYYRITVRVSGPRNTVSFVQAVVAM